jgi:hypothetical protein
MLCVSDCIRDGVRLAIPQTTERQHIGNEIDAAMIFARADLVNVHQLQGGKLVFEYRAIIVAIVARPKKTFLQEGQRYKFSVHSVTNHKTTPPTTTAIATRPSDIPHRSEPFAKTNTKSGTTKSQTRTNCALG